MPTKSIKKNSRRNQGLRLRGELAACDGLVRAIRSVANGSRGFSASANGIADTRRLGAKHSYFDPSRSDTPVQRPVATPLRKHRQRANMQVAAIVVRIYRNVPQLRVTSCGHVLALCR